MYIRQKTAFKDLGSFPIVDSTTGITLGELTVVNQEGELLGVVFTTSGDKIAELEAYSMDEMKAKAYNAMVLE